MTCRELSAVLESQPSSTPVVSLAGVRKTYGPLKILNDLSLTVTGGERLALMGASGCGKTTLLRCLNALEKVDSGNIHVLGHDLKAPSLDLNRFRARIGIVFQQFNLFPHLTVLDNIMLAPVKVKRIAREQARETAMSLLQRIGIADKASVYPDQLSGGQKQRVAIARSLAMEPELLLLDEPTSALDPTMTWEVLSLIEDVAEEGMTIVMVTHEVRFAEKVATRLVMMDQGRIVEEGDPVQVLRQPRHPGTQAYLRNFL